MDTIVLRPNTGSGESGNSGRLLVLHSLVPVASSVIAAQLEAFTHRLSEALFKVADQSIRPEEAGASFRAYNLLKRNSSGFYRLLLGQVNASLSKEVSTVNTRTRSRKVDDVRDLSLVTFDEMENKVLIGNLSHAIEVNHAEQLMALNVRIGHVLRRTPISVSQNPFRPEVFVRAVYQSWIEFDSEADSHVQLLHVLQPAIFLQLGPVFDHLNAALVERGVLPDINVAYRSSSLSREAARDSNLAERDPRLHQKLKNILSEPTEQPGDSVTRQFQDTLSPQEADMVKVDRKFFEYLTGLQKNAATSQDEGASHIDTSALRQASELGPTAGLNHIDQNTIELLVRIFDFVFRDPHIPVEIKNLIGQLQIPTLKVALMDKEFFFKDTHPARVLIDTLAKSSALLGNNGNLDDPLFQKIEEIVERVQQEFEQQLDLFSDVVSELESFLKEEELRAEEAITQPVAEALQQEKMRVAREFAENDVALRVETGEVAGFLENFLRDQWLRILTIAHSVKEQKPNALENALKTMDDLIWSLKPKNSAEERKELVSKLPAMLTLLNAWLNAIKWDEPSRVAFFSKLAERHAAIARAPLEFSPRRQLEIAVNIAQRASERRLNRHVQDQNSQFGDEWLQAVEALERGIWLDFYRDSGAMVRFKLAWVSPKRTRYIFTNRQGHDAFSISKEELVIHLRSGTAMPVAADSVVDRALTAALQDAE